MKKAQSVKKMGYAKLLTPKGNNIDGFAVSNDFEKVFFQILFARFEQSSRRDDE